MPNESAADTIVVGAGIAGASAGCWLARQGKVTLPRARVAARRPLDRSLGGLFRGSYGTPQIRALTMASRAFLDAPPEGFADVSVLAPRGALMVANDELLPQFDAQWQVMRES